MTWKRKQAGDDDPDIKLFADFLSGNDRAFAHFLERHNRRLFAYCIKMLGDVEAAQDVMQEVWERVVRMRSGHDAVANPMGLLMRIVRNLSLNYLRDERPHLSL